MLSQEGDQEAFTTVALGSTSSTRKILQSLLDHLSERFLNRINLDDPSIPSEVVSSVAGIIQSIIMSDETRINELIRWCTSASGAGLGHSVGLRRAVLAVIAQNKDNITTVLEKSLAQFGDDLYIRHAAVLQQIGTSYARRLYNRS